MNIKVYTSTGWDVYNAKRFYKEGYVHREQVDKIVDIFSTEKDVVLQPAVAAVSIIKQGEILLYCKTNSMWNEMIWFDRTFCRKHKKAPYFISDFISGIVSVTLN